jgi:hypothetical protein
MHESNLQLEGTLNTAQSSKEIEPNSHEARQKASFNIYRMGWLRRRGLFFNSGATREHSVSLGDSTLP